MGATAGGLHMKYAIQVLGVAALILAGCESRVRMAPAPAPVALSSSAAPVATAPAAAPAMGHHHGGAGHGAHGGPAAAPRRREWPKLTEWLKGVELDTAPAGAPTGGMEVAEHGRALFLTYCRNCHGDEGRGDGPRSPVFNPRPRDLAHGVFKFRSTPSGALPTPEDLFRTITGGIRGTGMLAFADLSEADRWALVAYMRSLSPRFASEAPEEVVAVPSLPDDLHAPARILRGKKVYAELKCADCHGALGRGDGPSAPTLVDEKKRPLPTPDFATRPLKRGADPVGTWLTIVTGLDGTPMPSYAESVRGEALWDLVAYTHSLHDAAGVSATDREEAVAVMNAEYAAAVHTVVGGCGCGAGGAE